MTITGTRVENDSMGEFEVPADAYYGATTMRAKVNFPISDLRLPRGFIRALGLIKQQAALVNRELGLLDEATAGAIIRAAQDVVDGALDAGFVLPGARPPALAWTLLPVFFDRLGAAGLRAVGILVEFFARAALAEQIPELVELDVDVAQARPLVRRDVLTAVEERVLFGDEGLDLLVDVVVVHPGPFPEKAGAPSRSTLRAERGTAPRKGERSRVLRRYASFAGSRTILRESPLSQRGDRWRTQRHTRIPAHRRNRAAGPLWHRRRSRWAA